MNDISSRIKQIMDEQNLRQIDIIERSKIICAKYGGKLTRQDLSQYVHGKVNPKQDKIFILAAALNVSEPWLMGFDVPKERMKVSSFDADISLSEREILRKLRYITDEARSRIINQLNYEYESERKKQAHDSAS